MSIRINLPESRCSAGSTITGTVSLHGDEDIDVRLITITLQARCKTKANKSNGNSRTTYRGRAPLIHVRKDLFAGPHTLHPGHSWPFTFTLPLQCDVRQYDHFKDQHGPFNSDPGQSLPPSFVDSNFGFGWSAECFVRYELEASLVGTGVKLFSVGDLASTRQLDFRTFRHVQTPDPQPIVRAQTIACYSLRLRPGYGDAPLTFKEKLKSMRTSQLPVSMFKIHMQLPRVGVPEQPLSAFLMLDHELQKSTAPEPPIVLLKKCRVALQAFTYIQCIRDEILREGDDLRDWDTEHPIASVDFSEKMESAPPLTENFDLRSVMKIKVPSYFKPTFSTFNIRRVYRLHLKVSVECVQKTFKAEFNTLEFVLLARDYMPSGTGMPGPAVSYGLDEVAPVYQKHAEPPPSIYSDGKVP